MRIIKNIKLPKVLLMLLLVLSSFNVSAQIYGPLLTDVWGGVNCVDNNGSTVYPLNYYTPNHCSPGCVAISLSQALHFYEWPISGTGNQVYNDNYNGSLKRHAAFFDSVEYDYANMLDEYKYKPSTDKEQEAVGKLVYHVATALQMDFEPTGSTSNVNKVPFVAQSFFRYSGHYEEPESYNSFWSRMKENIKKGHPVQVAIKDVDGGGAGHALIVDGYNESTGRFHLNWGWFNRNGINGWYDIENAWDGTGGGYDKVTGAMFDFYPIPCISEITKTGNGDGFTINWITSDNIVNDEYTLEQRIDGGAWQELAVTTEKSYTVNAPSGKVYQFRVKAKTDGNYYENSWSEIKVFAVIGGYDGYASMGGSQYAYARQTPNNDLNFTNDYTFETWIRINEANSAGNVVLDQQGAFSMYLGSSTSSSYSVYFKNYSNGAILKSDKDGTKIANEEWVHIAVSKSGDTARLFINGELKDESTSFKLVSSNSALNMAEKYSSGYKSRLKGDIDQVRISTIGRYVSNFTPNKEEQYLIDDKTVTYLKFQNVHGVRLHDNAAKLSFIVKNSTSNVLWEYEETENELANDDLELIASLISVYPNPVINNRLYISVVENELINTGKIQFILLDLNGKRIMLNNVDNNSSNQWIINLPSVQEGIYILQVDGGNFKMNRRIVIK